MRKANNYTPLDKPVTVTEQVSSVHTLPVVTVFNWVYNHKDYIRESIESILIQKTTFPVEIIIHDDASNDGTKEIILEYKEKYPQLFKNILHEKNQWRQGKSVMKPLFEKPRGKYIALTHGDDYWTDPYKLQKQVDFLEANPEYSICTHVVNEKNEFDGSIISFPNLITDTDKNIFDYIDSNHCATCSMLFNASYIRDVPEWVAESKFGDWALIIFILFSSNKKLMILTDVMGTYRVHSGGIHGSLKQSPQKLINAYKQHIDFINLIRSKLLKDKVYHIKIFAKKRKTYQILMNLCEGKFIAFHYYKILYYYFSLRVKIEKLYI